MKTPLYLTVQYGFAIPEVAENAQKAVAAAVEAMTGCTVDCVNIHVGGITLEMVDREAGVGELGWIVHRDYWGQGIVTEAAREILRFAKEDCGIKKLVAHCDCRNIPSRGAMEKLGLRFDHISGVRYDHQTKEPVDEYYYQMDL